MLTIKSIEIVQLFGTINHQIEFSKEDDITILLGLQNYFLFRHPSLCKM